MESSTNSEGSQKSISNYLFIKLSLNRVKQLDNEIEIGEEIVSVIGDNKAERNN